MLPALRNLKALDISENEFSGPIDLQGKFRKIFHFLIKNCDEFTKIFHFLVIVGICKLENLQELDMSVKKLVGQFPLCITSMSRLRVLDLSLNQLTGEVPSALGSLIIPLSTYRCLIIASKASSH